MQGPSSFGRYKIEPLTTQRTGSFRLFKNLLVRTLAAFELALIRRGAFEMLQSQVTLLADSLESKSQLLQDVFVLRATGMKKNGFFVEFGATNGVDLSNTFLLETLYGWRGILAEPARCWHDQLRKCRPASIIDSRCVYTKSGETIEFNETEVGEFSTIEKFSAADLHSGLRDKRNLYSVETVSLLDLLNQHSAPRTIDYLSIDTEGSEYSILSAFDFSKYDIRIITCEHNYKPDRQRIFDLLTRHGYRRVHEDLSQFDDWYVKS